MTQSRLGLILAKRRARKTKSRLALWLHLKSLAPGAEEKPKEELKHALNQRPSKEFFNL